MPKEELKDGMWLVQSKFEGVDTPPDPVKWKEEVDNGV